VIGRSCNWLAAIKKTVNLKKPRLLLTSLTSVEADQMTLQAKLKSAEVSLEQNHPDEAIRTCRLLIDATDAPQLERAALRIMGQAYERKKDHQSAIYCFRRDAAGRNDTGSKTRWSNATR
jgi:hypothetical protein